mgnify:CR=1 FL=1
MSMTYIEARRIARDPVNSHAVTTLDRAEQALSEAAMTRDWPAPRTQYNLDLALAMLAGTKAELQRELQKRQDAKS